MAAGRVHVSGRRVHVSYSDNYVESCRGRAAVVELNHDRAYRNGHNSAYGSPNLEDGEIPKYEGEFSLPVEKKRKFSPIVWDDEEKVPMKKGVVAATAEKSSRPQRGGLNDALDAGAAKYSIPAKNFAEFDLDSRKCATGSESGLVEKSSRPPLVKKLGSDHPECLGEEEGFAETRSIFKSRWASESPSDACLSDEEGSTEATVHRRGFSAERVGPSKEVLNGDRSRLSGSVEKDSGTGVSGVEDLENDVQMDVDVDRNGGGGGHDDDDDDNEQTSDYCDQIEGSDAASQGGVDMLQGCRSVYEYERLNEISEGAYGKVFKAKDKKSGEIVALKKMKMNVGGYRQVEDYGFPITALREINILLSFHHPSIVNVKEVVMGGMDDIFMVMEYMEHDLKGLMKVMKQPFSTSEVKCLMLQLLEGVKYLHDNWVLHRDLKTSNLLLNNEGELKICDFGMSRLYGSPLKSYTSLVVTLWYRAPELLLGAKKYSTAVDMWSVGCIMAELLAKEPLFKGDNEIDQLSKIFKILGTPSEASWPGFSKMPGAKAEFVNQPHNLLRRKFPASSFTGSSVLSDLGFDLLQKLLTYDPEKRLTVDGALNHPWFAEVPLPKSKAFMPTYPPQYAGNRIMFKKEIVHSFTLFVLNCKVLGVELFLPENL